MNKRHIHNHAFRQIVTVLLITLMMAGNASAQVLVRGNVYGGGNLADVGQSVTVNIKGGQIGDPEQTIDANHGNVYGGGALANTNIGNVDSGYGTGSEVISSTSTYTTTVNLTGGTIYGDAYGGGLGRAEVEAADAVGEPGTPGYKPAVEAVSPIEAKVYGDVLVTLDGTIIPGRVFGCNNINGSPKGHVKVHVLRTNHISGNNDYKNNSGTPLEKRTTYDVEAVYGGGNQADYNPTNANIILPDKDAADYNEKLAKLNAAFAEVLIEGCDKTSIEYVYGGGNAAAVPATQITINSVYIIDQLFGGGNGAGEGNPGADVGVIDKEAYAADPTTGIYGTGNAVTKLIGGQVHVVYGGSNTLGNVRGGTSLERNENNKACPLKVGEIYGAGQVAPMDGDVNIILECMPEDFVSKVFGGAKNATINGNVTLTVTSGKFGRVFGGNNEGGSINGSITVNVYEDGCQPLIIGELYGGGYNAPYSIWGCNDSDEDGTWTPNTPTPEGDPHVAANADAISVNVYSCTSIGKVFGGGFGVTADVVGNTHVWINMMKGLIDDPNNSNERIFNDLGKIGQVFGGGNAASVKGDVTIDIGTATVYKYKTNPQEEADYIGVQIESGNDYLNAEKNATTSITAGVYGGGLSADVDGSTTLNIGTEDQNIITIAGDIFGGGYGETTTVTGNVTVNIGGQDATTGDYVGYANITGDVYGGSAKGKVNATKSGTAPDITYTESSGATQVNFYGGTISGTNKGNIYGGGLGDAPYAADVYGPVTVNVYSGTANNVFGCNNVLGTPKNTVTVNINGGTVNQSVYGGGNQAAYTPTASNTEDYPVVSIINGTVTENVFGGGLGTTATVTGNPHVTIGDNVEGHTVAIKRSVYGGGSLATVDGSTYIVMNNGTIGTPKDGETVYGGATYGNIYGGGFGHNDNVRFGLVKGNTNVTVTGGNVLHSVYGGGAYGSVGTYTYASNDANAAISNRPDNNTGKATIHITGGTIGTDGHDNGMVFGSSRGDIAAPGAIQDNMAWVYDTEVVIGTENDETSGPTIHGSLYGSGENGHTFHNASVKMYSGTIGNPAEFYAYRGNVYGGGCGTDKYYSTGTETHDGHGDKYNKTAGIVKGNASVEILGGSVANNIYGAGSMGKVEGSSSVTINTEGSVGVDGNHDDGNVYGAARGELDLTGNIPSGDNPNDYSSVNTKSSVTITKGTVKGSVFGGGRAGVVTGQVTVQLDGGTVQHDVYGGGALAQTNTLYDGSHETYTTSVNLAGTAITGNLYGGGLGRLAVGGTAAVLYADVSEYNAAKGTSLTAEEFAALSDAEKTKTPAVGAQDAVAADVYGPITVTVTKGLATNVFGCNNVNGTPRNTVTVNINGTDAPTPVRPLPINNVYGGGNVAAYTYTDSSNPQNLQVNISGGTMDNVFGGGLSADVAGGINVNVTGGVIRNDVYGGGALANTNTANWNPNKEVTPTYDEVSFLTVGVSSVTGLYTESGGVYSAVTGDNPKAAEGVTYYRQITGGWADDTNTSTTYKTNVTLTGGIMGNAYGGGLGDVDTPIYVYGDVTVKLNEGVSNPTQGAAFTRETATNISVGGKNYPSIPTSGSVFGCNNINGTPKGNVLVEIFATRQLNEAGTAIISGHSPNADNEFYEVQAVYGGGNQADYQPLSTKKTLVVIRGCDETSIEKVYGGGNSAAVPETNVTIWGTFDVSDAFGGGNGSLPIKRGGVWIENAGSKVNGDTWIYCKGGKVGNVFGGSDAKGAISGSTHTDVDHPEGGCTLKITKIYGASKEADVDGDVNVIINGCSSDDIEYVCGGSYNANIRGDITLTITSGIFKNVYGGNDARGSIGGTITVNIQEEDACKPIIIQNLVGGGYAADYPGKDSKTGGNAKRIRRNAETGEYIADTFDDYTTGKITVNVKSATRIDNIYGGGFRADVNGDTEVNINMIKGLWAGVKAPTGYTTLPNVHQTNYYKVLGLTAGTSVVTGLYTRSGDGTNESPYVYTEITAADTKAVGGTTYYRNESNAYVIDDAIGTVGNVFGGGNEGNIYGDAVVNIGSETVIPTMYRGVDGNFVTHKDVNNVQVIDYQNSPVLGANITGDIYGGGNLAHVGNYEVVTNAGVTTDNILKVGNTTVNIGVKDDSGYKAVAEGTEKVKIAGNVFGGGRGEADSFRCGKAMVTGSTNVRIGNGSIGNGTTGGNVYGGGKVGRIEANTAVTIGFASGATSSPEIKGNVFGAGQGLNTYGYSALVRGNTTVTVDGNAKVGNSVYGGGEIASVGRYNVADAAYHALHPEIEEGMPYSLGNENSGYCTVIVRGNAEIGPNDMTMPTFSGNVFGGGKGVLPYEGFEENEEPWRMQPTGIKEYYSDITEYEKFIETLALATKTDVTIGGNAFVKGSVYGGSENGIVQHDTHVLIAGGQIGNGSGTGKNARFDWSSEDAANFSECAHWPYATPHAPYDKYANETGYDSDGASVSASDGHTFYGNVFGGGSGKDPYKPGKWHRKAGYVGGNTFVNITDGHILTCVYGGNEHTDVGSGEDLAIVAEKGKCTVNMTGGTLGVPRTVADAKAHPVTCYLFGAGKGDQRIFFNKWTNVSETVVNVTGTARIYGSVFGGGEDGHVLGNAAVNIGGSVTIDGTTYTADSSLKIGTTGTSYVDGNVFGGGRGFSGEALTAGAVVGNVTMTISGGTMLGSVYGGGRLASVGTGLENVTLENGDPNPAYGLIYDDTDKDESGSIDPSEEHGHIAITISGGTIGNGVTASEGVHSVSGNVFGGSMGRITLLNGNRNPIWPKLAVAKLTNVTISGGEIYNSVYGGSEYGIVRNRATVNILPNATPANSPVIHGNVFGGGYGSDEQDKQTIKVAGYDNLFYTFTPLLWTGCVSGDTFVNISGGKVEKNVYGGGELASVGLIDFVSDEAGIFTNMPKHESLTDGFGLSWPYKFTYHAAAPNDDAVGGKAIGGKSTVTITGGHIGSTTWNDGSGYVFGGSKGKVDFGITSISDQRYTEAFCANVRETEVIVNFTTPSGKNSSNIGAETNCIMGAVYGGGEDGHVYEDAKVNITGGLIGLSVYGAGKGISTYKGYLKDGSTPATDDYKSTKDDLYSWTAGKVYGNATVTMTGGHVLNNVYGGGYLASVGKGNYSGGLDDYFPAGYGETLTGNLWDNVSDYSKAFLSSGKVTVKIEGGTVGTLNGTYGSVGGDASMATPTGMVFGGSRGQAAEDVILDPRYEYAPNFNLGYVNETEVTIGTKSSGGPRIFGQVFGGGRDGHVRNSAHVIINDGTIGQTYAETTEAGGNDAEYHRYHRGNVYGSGSGLGLWDSSHHGMSSGSVTRNTTVDINGGTIYNNVYGGGALSSVGPPRIDLTKDYAPDTWSKCVVNINGGTIGQTTPYETNKYGGCVFGASRGNDFATGETPENFATVLWTEVNINGGSIAGNVYGGAKGGLVWKDTKVNLKGGTIAHNAYGGGQGTTAIAANVDGNTTVELNNNNNGGDADGSKKGCIVDKVFGCNDLNGTPKGHVKVHVYATQNSETANISTKVGPGSRTSLSQGDKGYIAYMRDLIALAKNGDVIKPGITESVITTAQATINGKEEASLTEDEKTAISTAATNVIAELQKTHVYDVTAVYGGGDLAPYVPTVPEDKTEVIIEGCDVTSIKQVYGGGNAAYVPATDVLVKSVYVIDELFGGGNGLDNYKKDTDGKWYENPGANVGYTNYFHYVKPGDTDYNADTHGTGAVDKPYKAIPNDGTDDAVVGAETAKQNRIANYSFGTGVASTTVNGGYIHNVYGGSNIKGNIRSEALLQINQIGVCPLIIDKTYSGSKEATIDAETNTSLDCVREGGIIYGGSYNADIINDVHIQITNGHYTKVFGGNNIAGTISGSITIDVEEKGCTPIEIDELYAGGYLAPYSVYGYSSETREVKDENGNVIEGITQRIPYKEGESGALATPKRDPQINIISATKIGKIFGGGYRADLIGSPHVNVNMTTGRILRKFALEYPDITEEDAKRNKILPLGTIGSIYGGGYLGDVIGDTHVEIGTGEWLSFTGQRETLDADSIVYTYNSETNKWDWTKTEGETTTSGTVANKPVPGRNAATITGNVFGGGQGEASTENGGDAFYCKPAMVGEDGDGVDTDGNPKEGGTSIIIANGTVGTLEAGKLVEGTGNVYGGGEIGRVERNTEVTIGVTPKVGETIDNTNFKPTVYGSVFGAGKGVPTHGYSALVRGNSTVTIQGFAKVGESVYGGGEIASVGRYKVKKAQGDPADAPNDVAIGMPYSLLKDNSGKCTVVVRDNAEIGPDNMTMFHVDGSGNIVDNDEPDNSGHVFGAGKGAMPGDYTFNGTPYPYHMTLDGDGNSVWETINTEEAYLKFIETLGLATQTEVTIGGNAFVKGDVFGGAEQGFVQHNTKVTIEGNCQIGNGYVQMNADGGYLARTARYSLNRRYTDAEWSDGHLTGVDGYENSLPECASWEYTSPYAPHDIYAGTSGYDSKGGALVATNGSTFYGNVFGGGSGYFPYAPGKWHWKAGDVGGNTVVDIKGGHILTNVYGGNELTNVAGTSTVTMSGGTIGVPRTLGQIAAHPVTCYLFGGGKGDPRVLFNKQTNIQDAIVNITGGWIYGSVFGGGEDGHVMRNVTMTIGGESTKIGTWGTSYVDGNVFGGGRGFSADAYTAGNVAGSVSLTINGGEILGSVYGGGRLGSVGYGLYEATETEDATGHKMYGEMQDDGYGDWYKNNNSQYVRDAIDGFKRGYVEINITGGTIGNTNEFIVPNETNISAVNTALSTSLSTDFTTWNSDNWKTWKSYYNVPNTEYDTSNGRVLHTKGGNVFAGGMGRLYQLDGSTPISAVDWWRLGNVKHTKLTIKGGTIKSNVYGGGELGQVVGSHTTKNAADKDVSVGTEVIIEGGTIGTEIQEGGTTKYTFGSVFGGGYGSLEEKLTHTGGKPDSYPKYIAGRVKAGTKVNMTSGTVQASVYGGGEMAAVGESTALGETLTEGLTGDTHVIIGGGMIGHAKVGDTYFGGAKMGNVYGGGSGHNNTVRSGHIYGNTNVTITAGTIYHNVYGGGAYGTVGDFKYDLREDPITYTNKVFGVSGRREDHSNSGVATVTITGGTIGIDGHENGMVFGSSRGDINKPGERDDHTAWVYDTNVIIGTAATPASGTEGEEGYVAATPASGPEIKGSVYGSGENGHTFNNTVVTMNGGTIGIPSGADITYTENGQSVTKGGAAYPYRGNVYGGGCGTDKYYENHELETHDGNGQLYNALAGIVYGTTTVNVNDGTVVRNVYGAGAMGSVGKATTDGNGKVTIASGGTTTVTISGGQIGGDNSEDQTIGNVFGAARGDETKQTGLAQVQNTNVMISGGTVNGSVFGGGERGVTLGSVVVNMTGGTVVKDIYGGGALADTNTDNWVNNALVYQYQKVTLTAGAPLSGYYTRSGSEGSYTYTLQTEGTYTSGTYYERIGTKVNLLGGTVNDVYGGALGQKAGVNGAANNAPDVPAIVYGDVKVNLNGLEPADYVPAIHNSSLVPSLIDTDAYYLANSGCLVSGNVYGCNNINGTPKGHAKVHVFKTVNNGKIQSTTMDQRTAPYDVAKVFGGGHSTDYVPADTKQSTEVIIEGCDLTSIEEVYGGGYGAAVPGTEVLIKGTYIIDKVFGGGYGYSATNNHIDPTAPNYNPGANVGYRTDGVPYGKNTNVGDYKTANVKLMAGYIHHVYGASNTKGDIRGGSSVTNVEKEVPMGSYKPICENLFVDDVFGGGKDAPMDGGTEVVLGCMPDDWVDEVYAGSQNADVEGDVSLTITSGKFGRVFGGNKAGGILDGGIYVNIEENPTCAIPIVIGEVYGGGNEAPYSAYGYTKVGDKWQLNTKDESTYELPYPVVVHAKAFTSIGKIFGGGKGEEADLIGNPSVLVDEVGSVKTYEGDNTTTTLENGLIKKTLSDDTEVTLYPRAMGGTMGVVGTIFGGGNEADVDGNTSVYIGALDYVDFWSVAEGDDVSGYYVPAGGNGTPTDPFVFEGTPTPLPSGSIAEAGKKYCKKVIGADIRGNIYGGGNNAEVKGNTNVVIGKKEQ